MGLALRSEPSTSCVRFEMTNGSYRSPSLLDVDPFGYTQGVL